MATDTQNHAGKGSYGGQSFEPINYDVDTMEPDVYPGAYRAKCTKAEAKASKKGKPMIELTWTMTSTESEDEGPQKSIGAEKRDWIVFTGGRGGNFGKLKLRALRDGLGLDPDVIPTAIGSIGDLRDLCAALKNQETDVWVTAAEGEEGEDTQLSYSAPKEGTLSPMGGTDDDEEPAAPPAKATKAKPVQTKKSARR